MRLHASVSIGLLGAASVDAVLSARWPVPVVSLPYATYQGFHNETSGLDVFLGVRYAANTEGQNRWRAAQPPPDQSNEGYINATVYPPQCPQAVAGVGEVHRPSLSAGHHPRCDLQSDAIGRLGGLSICQRVSTAGCRQPSRAGLDPRWRMGP